MRIDTIPEPVESSAGSSTREHGIRRRWVISARPSMVEPTRVPRQSEREPRSPRRTAPRAGRLEPPGGSSPGQS